MSDSLNESVRIRSFSGPYFPAIELNANQKNFEYGAFYAVSLPFSAIQTHFPLLELNFFVGFTVRQPTQLAFTCSKPLIKTEAKDVKPA